MSLYDAAPNDSNLKVIAAVGNRPMWLTITLALAVIYALAALTQLVVRNQEAITKHAEHIAKMREINEPLRNLRGNGDLMAKLDAITEKSEASFKERQSKFPARVVVHALLIVVSAIYLFKPITAVGLAAAGIWVASLLALCSRIFEMDIAIANYFLILPNLGIGNIGKTGAVIQILVPIAIFMFSSIKYRPAPKT